MKILLVDDDAEIRFIATFVLQEAGHQVVEAADGAAAFRLLTEVRPDLVLMDVMLGEEDGVAVAEDMMAQVPGLRLAYLTGATRPEQMERLRASGAAGIVHKPFDPEALADQVSALLPGHG